MHLLMRSLLLVGLITASTAVDHPAWDASLLSLRLGSVHLEGNSLPVIWQEINTTFAVRGVLFEDESIPVAAPCRIALEDATLGQVMAEMLRHHPNYALTPDPETGVLWIHPRAQSFETLESVKVTVAHDERGVAFGSMVLPVLLAKKELNLSLFARGVSARNALEWPVDLRGGQYSLRSLWNHALQGNPAKSLYFYRQRNGKVILEVISTLGEPSQQPRAGAVAWWSRSFDKPAPHGPTWEGLTEQLANRDQELRAIARGYLEMNSLNVGVTSAWNQLPFAHQTEGVWTTIALASAFAPRADSSYSEAEQLLGRLFEKDAALMLPPALALLAACEYTRLARRDTGAIAIVAQRGDLAGADLLTVADDLQRLVRMSSDVRTALELNQLGASIFPRGLAVMGESLQITVTSPVIQPSAPVVPAEKDVTSIGKVIAVCFAFAALLVGLVMWLKRKR